MVLITALYSRKIVSDSLRINGCVRAFKKATCQNKLTQKLIHHSDKGIQYCSNVYANELKRKKTIIAIKTI